MRWWQVADSKIREGEWLNAKDSNEVNKITRTGRYSMRNSTPENGTSRPATKLCCNGCGNDAHPKRGVCPARSNNYLKCGRSSHFARMCPKRKPNRFGKQVKALKGWLEPNESHPEEDSEAVGELNLYQVTGASHEIQLWRCKLTLSQWHDTQADATVFTEKHFESLKGTSRLQSTKVLVGCFTDTFSRNQMSIEEVIYVVWAQGTDGTV